MESEEGLSGGRGPNAGQGQSAVYTCCFSFHKGFNLWEWESWYLTSCTTYESTEALDRLSTDIRIRTDLDFFRKNPWKSTKKTNQTQQTPSVSRQRKTETLSGLASSEVDFIVKAQRKKVATVKGIPRWSPPCCQAVKNNPNLRGSLGKAHRRISADLSWWS